MKRKNTSWGHVASWYSDLLEDSTDTYQTKVILPNLLRVMKVSSSEHVLDLACGQGFFARELAKAGHKGTGIDVSPELISKAKALSPESDFKVGAADNLSFLKGNSFDSVLIVLALQNIENLQGTIAECHRVLKKGGNLFIVLNHPAFRIPRYSGWGWDEENKTQFRRIEHYLSENSVEIDMHPGSKEKKINTFSFHRSLQVYSKAFIKNNFSITGLEEWISHKKSQKGPRALAEDTARKEIPLFLMLKATKPL